VIVPDSCLEMNEDKLLDMAETSSWCMFAKTHEVGINNHTLAITLRGFKYISTHVNDYLRESAVSVRILNIMAWLLVPFLAT
jgi:hypothetical protein